MNQDVGWRCLAWALEARKETRETHQKMRRTQRKIHLANHSLPSLMASLLYSWKSLQGLRVCPLATKLHTKMKTKMIGQLFNQQPPSTEPSPLISRIELWRRNCKLPPTHPPKKKKRKKKSAHVIPEERRNEIGFWSKWNFKQLSMMYYIECWLKTLPLYNDCLISMCVVEYWPIIYLSLFESRC